MKNHLKSIAAPRTWAISRRRGALIMKPNPGGHTLSLSLPLGLLLRDALKLVRTTHEAKKVLHRKEVLVDGKCRQDLHFPVGLFDVLHVAGKAYRLLIDRKGRLVVTPITEKESFLKLCSITGKAAVPGGKIQVRCHDGRTFITEEKLAVGDSILFSYSLPKMSGSSSSQAVPAAPAAAPKVEKIFPRVPGALALLVGGKHSGSLGIFTGMKGDEAVCQLKEKKSFADKAFADKAITTTTTTKKDYLFVVGDKAPALQVTP